MRPQSLIGLACLVIALVGARAQTVALTHVDVINVETGAVDRDQNVVITAGRIIAVGPAATVAVPPSAQVHELRNRYVIPGLWDMHAHLGQTGRASLSLYLANGVTGVRDMGSVREILHPWKDSIARGLLPGPRVVAAGPIVERASWIAAVRRMVENTGDSALMRDLAQRIPVSTPASARLAVDSIIALGGDFVKVRTDPSAEATFALLRRARERGISVAGHWPFNITPAQASDSGYRSLEHGPLTSVGRTLVPTLARMSTDERRVLFEKFKRNGTAYTPTLIALVGFRLLPDSIARALVTDSLGRRDPRMRYMSSSVLKSWQGEFDIKKQETGEPVDWEAASRSWNNDLRDMAAAGVLILAGTDAGSPLVFTGFSVSDELELMARNAGLTPLQCLRSATINVATWMDARADFGTVQPGRRADLAVLRENPLADITNVRGIVAMMRDGQFLDRAALDRMLALVERK